MGPPLRPDPTTRASPTGPRGFWKTFHYSHDNCSTRGISEKFFDGYLETLDPSRENFLQSDIDEFAHYRTNLDTFTIGDHGTADLTPAYEIYRRYLERSNSTLTT